LSVVDDMVATLTLLQLTRRWCSSLRHQQVQRSFLNSLHTTSCSSQTCQRRLTKWCCQCSSTSQ